MSSIEGVHDWYCFGLLLFPAFNSDTDPDAWLNVYWLFWLDFIAFILFFTRFEIKQKSLEWI
jgi:hypothetical protein